MKRPRPHIPLSVRVEVIARQILQAGRWSADQVMLMCLWPASDGEKIKLAIALLFGAEPVALDHNPSLRAREFSHRTGKYTPDANDPDHLIYRTVEEHKLKTNVRGDGAQFPDRVMIVRERKRERKAAGINRPKARFQNRSAWPPRGSRSFSNRGVKP